MGSEKKGMGSERKGLRFKKKRKPVYVACEKESMVG